MTKPADTYANVPSTAATLGGCDACMLGVCITNGNEIEACDDCARHGGHASRNGASDDDVASTFVKEALAALADVREILWPDSNPEADWSPDSIEAVARRLAFLAPSEGRS